MNRLRMFLLYFWLAASVMVEQSVFGSRPMDITIANEYLRLVITSDAKVTQFVDVETGKNYALSEPTPAALVIKDGREYAATAAAYSKGKLTLKFDPVGMTAVLNVNPGKRFITMEVVAVEGDCVDEFAFVHIPTNLKGRPDELFSACVLALNLKTNVTELPKATSKLHATCYAKTGFVGAKAAVIGCPSKQLRSVMQEAVNSSPDLPHSPVGGPWALDFPANRASYLFNFGDLTEQTVDRWIDLARNLGIPQIDFHGGGSFRFGDCEPNPKMYPNGLAGFKAVIDKLHAAGIKAGLHTYAFFIDKHCPWVTPIPDPGLAKDATFSLAKSIGETDTDVPVVENTKDMSATTGFFVRNSATVQIDDELIVYTGVSKEPPYAFTGCQRGAYGTKVAAHAAGAKVHHLKECFGLFAPDPESELFTKVVQATADFYNECGFDMIYLDALDGEDVLGGWEWGWHYGSKFVFELYKRLKKAPIMEMSTFHHHLWFVRSRMGAWDHPNRSHKLFIDIHCRANESCRDMFLPAHLGWWRVIADSDPRVEPTFADDIEYLCAKCAGWDCGLSPQGFTPETWAASSNLRRLGDIIRRWEEARLSGAFSESDKAKLRVPGDEYTLVEVNGKPCIKPIQYTKHKVEGLDSTSAKWTVLNKYGPQPVKLRIEALYSAAPYDSADCVVLIDFNDLSSFTAREAADGVTADIKVSQELVKTGGRSGLLIASRIDAGHSEQRTDDFSPLEHGQRRTKGGTPSWAKIGTTFSPVKDLSNYRALGVWVYGDGQGEVINLQLRNPSHMIGGVADHYVVVDFEGWRYFELIEPEGDRIDDYTWPYAQNVYALYRELVNPAYIESFNIWINNLPPKRKVSCYLSPIKALRLVATKLKNPSFTVGGKTIVFPVELQTGQYVEYFSTSNCKLYGSDGNLITDIIPYGDVPILQTGTNEVRFSCEPPEGDVSARTRVTVIAQQE